MDDTHSGIAQSGIAQSGTAHGAEAVDAKGRPLSPVPARVPWLEVAVFVVTVVALGWLVCLPLWVSGEGLRNLLLVQICGQALMLTPLAATVVAMIVQRRRARRRQDAEARGGEAPAPPTEPVGFEPAAAQPATPQPASAQPATPEPAPAQPAVARYLGIWPLRPFGRVLGMSAAAMIGTYLLVTASYFLGAALGWVNVDLSGLTGLRAQLAALPGLDSLPLGLAVVIYLAIIVMNSLVTAIFAFGEEVGWRGWLLTSLRPWGTWRALLAIGVLWGMWHAPLILLGYNFGRPDITGLGVMVGGCVMLSVLFGWLRLRTGSLWPPVLAHGALNGSSSMLLALFIDANAPMPDMALIAVLGVTGWIVSAVIIAILLLTGQFRQRPELGQKPHPPR